MGIPWPLMKRMTGIGGPAALVVSTNVPDMSYMLFCLHYTPPSFYLFLYLFWLGLALDFGFGSLFLAGYTAVATLLSCALCFEAGRG